jgi:hypothetical protein
MSGRAQWLASRQAILSSPASTPVPLMPPRPARRSKACRIHGTMLLDVDAHGHRYRNPICLECLPPHRPSCIQGEYVEKQTIFYALELAEDPAYDMTDVEFWARFDLVPDCRCPERQRAMEIREERPIAEPAPAFELSIGKEASAYHWRTMTTRLRRLAQEAGQQRSTGLAGTWQKPRWRLELEQLAGLLDLIPAESPRDRARAILARLEAFELGV